MNHASRPRLSRYPVPRAALAAVPTPQCAPALREFRPAVLAALAAWAVFAAPVVLGLRYGLIAAVIA